MTFAVGNYQAVELLGIGASAQVWRGQHLTSGETVALKVFPPDRLAAVRREAALAAAVDHPHVVAVLDVVADEHRAALVTEHAGGGDLAGLLARRGRLTPGQTLTVLIPLASALATAHERQIVHGDISAANVVLDRAGRPLLADLGAARAAMESGRPVQATPCDAAPELARAGAPTPASDLFSLGSVALACLTGRSAWPADDLRDVLIQAAAGQWPDLPDDAGPPALVAAVRSLLEHDPDRRPGAASLVLELRSAGRPEPLDVSTKRSGGSVPLGAGGAAAGAEPDRPRSHRRHGRPDDEPPGDSDSQWPWPDPDAEEDGRAEFGSRGVGGRPGNGSGASTKVRADARPADGAGAGHSPGRSALLRSPRILRIAALVAGGLVVTVIAGLAGLWWADHGRANPVAAQRLPVVVPSGVAGRVPSAGTSGAPTDRAPTDRAPTDPVPTARASASTARAPAAGTGQDTRAASSTGTRAASSTRARAASSTGTRAASSTRAGASTAGGTRAASSTRAGASTAGASAPTPATTATSRTTAPTSAAGTADWTATIRALDRARAKALVSRDAALLDEVYTADCTARSADAQTIRTLISDGMRVSGAAHEVQSVEPVTGSATTMLVRDSLPAYQVLGTGGSVIGRTPQRRASARVMVLVQTAGGYRISEVRAP